LRALSERCFLDNFFALAVPPLRPNLTALGSFMTHSVALRIGVCQDAN
jgi:hypothetical protein